MNNYISDMNYDLNFKPETVDIIGFGKVTTVLCPCGHRGFYSTWPDKNGNGQCTACANSMRF